MANDGKDRVLGSQQRTWPWLASVKTNKREAVPA